MHDYLFSFILTLLAGLSTAIGGVLAFFIKKESVKPLAIGLGFSAGVMIYVSLVEILAESKNYLIQSLGTNMGGWVNILAFFSGIIIAAIIDKFFPEHMHSLDFPNNGSNEISSNQKLHRMGIFTAIAIAIHNFPEGLATFMSGMTNVTLGISIAAAIAIHNIPEGISVALPIYKATLDRKKAFWYSFWSGMTEPIGAIAGFFLLKSLFNDISFGILFAMVAGIMVYISFDELLPTAREYGDGHLEILGLVAGMLLMSISLQLF